MKQLCIVSTFEHQSLSKATHLKSLFHIVQVKEASVLTKRRSSTTSFDSKSQRSCPSWPGTTNERQNVSKKPMIPVVHCSNEHHKKCWLPAKPQQGAPALGLARVRACVEVTRNATLAKRMAIYQNWVCVACEKDKYR